MKSSSNIQAIMGFKESPPDSAYPLFLSGVSAGFPSPAEDYIDKNYL